MSLIMVRRADGADPADVARAFRLLNNEVVPALRGLLGARVVLPSAVVVGLGPEHDPDRVDGRVPASRDVAGAIRDIGDPMVGSSSSDARLRWSLVHELAHFHELSVRRAEGIAVRSQTASMMWSEYFAQRVAWASGLMDEQLLLMDNVADEPVGQLSPEPKTHPARVLTPYVASWLLAEWDHDRDGATTRYPAGKRILLEALVGTASRHGTARELFDSFPRWDPADADRLVGFFRVFARSCGSVGESRR